MGAQAGIAPADIDRCDAFSVLAMLGVHRHPDYWRSDFDLGGDDPAEEAPAPPSAAPRGRRSRGVASRRGTPGLEARDASRGLFEARRAAARGDAPPPEAAPPSAAAVNVANVLTGGRVTRGH